MRLKKQLKPTTITKHGQKYLDTKILRGCIRQRLKSQEALYKTYYAYGMSICLRYAANRDEAVDIMNDAFIKVFQNIKKYDKTQAFTTWFRAIIINTAVDFYREHSLYKQHISYSETDDIVIKSEFVDNLDFEDIMKILRELSEQQRLVFNLYEIEGYSHKEIADKLKITESSSRSYLSHARKEIRHKYMEYNNDTIKPLQNLHSELIVDN